MSNTVDQPTAALLQEAGWEKWTWFAYFGDLLVYRAGGPEDMESTLIPAPNVTEIGEELKWSDYYQYWWRATDAIIPLAEWLYSVMHDANELAKVWLWAKEVKP